MGNRASQISAKIKEITFYSDITDNLDVNPHTGQLALVTNEEDVKNSLRRMVQYGRFEREYDAVGGNIRKLLFEPVDAVNAAILQTEIEATCRREPRASVHTVVVNEYPDHAMYICNITFSMLNNPTPVTFDIILKRIR